MRFGEAARALVSASRAVRSGHDREAGLFQIELDQLDCFGFVVNYENFGSHV